ncbi:NAD(P)/FAD-dependent oxidoreductase [Sporolactobacillus spathodeae]|uniref:Flavin-dependent dehydrogenase n=1 Tax=Sporolactobacillus spathodeae TaxID=1465502 RepID=A0ABS2QBS8_9BACL|nr:NAD(P)/FAD-dependent oxidoreductase [Sporolactobacillus spathodeae]MBM7659051.1 flavin-dependent dehydrogenase [Sporolactobacillus spathodeae]
MKVAIMGAGLSGLSAAIILERYGVSPVIFEKRSQAGDRFINAEAMLSLLTRPIIDPIRYLSEEFQIFLKPISHINPIIIHSENVQTIINEHVGFTNIRGRNKNSFEAQLASQVTSKIRFNAEVSYEDLLEKFTHVIMATGDASYAIKLHNYREDLSVSLKGATVEGVFTRSEVSVWLDNNLAPKGYAYLIPFSDTEANIVVAVPDLTNEVDETITDYWNRFYDLLKSHLNQSLKITDQFQITNYKIGICDSPRIGNTFFTGNCFGAIMPFLGFGQFESILTGIYAAYDICGLGKYDALTEPLRKSYQHSLILRRGMEALNNQAFDFIVARMNGYLGKQLFKPSGHDPLKWLSYLARPFV